MNLIPRSPAEVAEVGAELGNPDFILTSATSTEVIRSPCRCHLMRAFCDLWYIAPRGAIALQPAMKNID